MTAPVGAARPPVLLVGVGSELRSDDAAGRHVAERLVGRHPAGAVEVRAVHQLTPELADAMTGRRLVVVIDASVEVAELTVEEVAGEAVAGAMTHHLDVAALVRYAEQLGDRPTQVRTLAVPAHDLTLGTDLSPRTAAAVADAAVRLTAMCRDVLGPAVQVASVDRGGRPPPPGEPSVAADPNRSGAAVTLRAARPAVSTTRDHGAIWPSEHEAEHGIRRPTDGRAR